MDPRVIFGALGAKKIKNKCMQLLSLTKWVIGGVLDSILDTFEGVFGSHFGVLGRRFGGYGSSWESFGDP